LQETKKKEEEKRKKGSKTIRLEFLPFIMNTTRGVWALSEDTLWGIKQEFHAPKGNAAFTILLPVNN
jgi:hypothetical protein